MKPLYVLPALLLHATACPAQALPERLLTVERQQLASLGPGARESRLRSLIAEFPGDAQIRFELGNLLARQTRWPEARRAYRNAADLAPEHPDIHFNLAVAHEQLGAESAALRHYRIAERFAKASPHAFPDFLPGRRIATLEGRRQ